MVERWPDPDLEIGDARVAEAARRRRLRHHEAEIEAAEATFGGTLRALAELGADVAIRVGGRVDNVVVENVDDDWMRVRGDLGLGTVRVGAVSLVEPGYVTGAPLTASGASRGERIEISDEIAGFAGTGVPVQLVLTDGSRVGGEVVSCGIDVVHLRRHGATTALTYVALDSVNELWSSSRP